MDIDQAVETAAEFLDEYVHSRREVASGAGVEFQEVRAEAGAGEQPEAVVLVFGLPTGGDPDAPSDEAQRFARQCAEALLAAHPAVSSFELALEFMA
jgi:hypothetical protein